MDSSIKTTHYRSIIPPWVFRTLILAYAFNCFSFITADPDLWGHITFGGQTLSLGGPSPTNDYSYTASDHPWINHEWLAEVIFNLIFLTMGSTGLLVLKMLIGLFIVQILSNHYWQKEKNGWVYLIYFFIMIPVLAPGFMARPHIFTLLFLTLEISILQFYFAGDKKIIYFMPLIIAIWVNSHGGVLAGLGLFGLVSGSAWIQSLLTGTKKDLTLIFCFALSALALLINPYGYKLIVFYYESLSLPRNIGEWEPIQLLSFNYWKFKLLSLIFLITLYLRGKKHIWEILIISVTIWYGFKHQRHTALAAIVMTPYLSLKLSQLIRKINFSKIYPYMTHSIQSVLTIGLGVLLTWNIFVGLKKNGANNFKIWVEPTIYPNYVVQFMETNKIQGNILVPFDWGEYLIWKLPESKISIDGRFRTAYPNDVIGKHKNFIVGNKSWRDLITNYPTDIVLTRIKDSTHLRMNKEKDWINIYQDQTASLYIRKTNPPNRIENIYNNKQFKDPIEAPSYTFP